MSPPKDSGLPPFIDHAAIVPVREIVQGRCGGLAISAVTLAEGIETCKTDFPDGIGVTYQVPTVVKVIPDDPTGDDVCAPDPRYVAAKAIR